MANRHNWTTWDNYKNVNDSYFKYYKDFIQKNDFHFTIAEEVIEGAGEIELKNGVVIKVKKELEIKSERNKKYVRTVKYSYHVVLRKKDEEINLFRYDNFHIHKGHSDEHHKHIFHTDGKEEIVHIGAKSWPTLGEVIKEALNL